jgi:hypothetical protein
MFLFIISHVSLYRLNMRLSSRNGKLVFEFFGKKRITKTSHIDGSITNLVLNWPFEVSNVYSASRSIPPTHWQVSSQISTSLVAINFNCWTLKLFHCINILIPAINYYIPSVSHFRSDIFFDIFRRRQRKLANEIVLSSCVPEIEIYDILMARKLDMYLSINMNK